MTVDVAERTAEISVDTPEGARPPEGGDLDAARAIDPLRTSVAAFLAAAAAGWMCAGLFRGPFPRVVALIGPVIGAGLVALSYRTRRPSLVQYLALPAGVLAGTLLVIAETTGGSANLPGLVAEAIRTGGVAQPPIPFDPGWRFILVVLTTGLAAAAASLAIGSERPRLATFVALPLVFAGALIQPKAGMLLTTGVSVALIVASLAVAYGVELAREGATSGRFEIRRLGRGLGVVALLLLILFGLSRAGFLFPERERDQEIPPKRPESQPPQADRVLFTVRSDRPGPWRLGVLDVYDRTAFLLPPYRTSRLVEVRGTDLPASLGASDGQPAPPADGERVRATFEVRDVEGHVIPTLAGAERLRRETGFAVQFDPRTQMLRLPESRARQGMRYTVEAPPPPTAEQLAAAPPPPQVIRELFVDGMPAPPVEVAALLRGAPPRNAFERLQFVRNAFYAKVVAKGAGNPVDVPPSRVADMLGGLPASPYEITAAEVMLARWAGIPARIGYGFYAGEKDGDVWSVRPKHGSTWLEAYFHGVGWVPVIGTPPRAQTSISQDEQQQDPAIRPTEELALLVYVPIRLESIRLAFVVVRYWLGVVLPFAIAALLVYAFYPGAVKAARRFRRHRWASGRDPEHAVLAAYAEFRDAATDLNIGDPTATPLAFLGSIADDAEHRQLAWLVTRALWGDLTRDLRPQDAEAAEDMARSVARRVRRAQPAIARAIAFGSRASLRDPYTDRVPNLWPARRARDVRRSLRSWRVRGALAGCVLIVAGGVVALVARGDGDRPAAAVGAPVIPDRIVPEEVEGLRVTRETDIEGAFDAAGPDGLVATGRVFTLRDDEGVLGALQVGSFKPGLDATDRELREGVLGGVESGTFELTRVGDERIYVQRLAEQRILVWFSPRMEYYELFVGRQGFEAAERVFARILAYQRGDELRTVPGVVDPRRGAPE